MLLLNAINTCLSALGEARVTSSDVRHPTVDTIRVTLEQKRHELLERGWWFNTSDVKMYPSAAGRMEYPHDALAVLGYAGEVFMPRDGMLFDLDENTDRFTEAKQFRVTYDLEFENLPECAANVVMYRTAQEVYSGDLGVDSAVQRMNALEIQNYMTMEMLHLRNKRYSARQRPGFHRYRTALLG